MCKNCPFCHFRGCEFCSFGKFQPSKSAKIHKNQNSKCGKMADFEIQGSSKLISRKISMTQKSWNFFAVDILPQGCSITKFFHFSHLSCWWKRIRCWCKIWRRSRVPQVRTQSPSTSRPSLPWTQGPPCPSLSWTQTCPSLQARPNPRLQTRPSSHLQARPWTRPCFLLVISARI